MRPNAGKTFSGERLMWYEMADSSILKSGNPFFVPDFDTEFKAYPTVVYRIGRLGKSIAPRFADRYIDAVGPGTAIIAESLLQRLKEAGLPWTRAVSFDRSLLLGNLQPIDALINNKAYEFEISTQKATYSIDNLHADNLHVIAELSQENTLKNGDLILVGLMPVGLNLVPGSKLTARAESLKTNLLDINIK